MSKNKTWNRIVLLSRLGLSLALLLLGLVLPAGAQEGRPDRDPPPPRGVEREALPREPRVLQRTALPGDAIRIVVELPAEADAYIASGRPGQNFGSDALYLGYNLTGDPSFDAERTLLRFDLQGTLPEGVVINEARLRLRLNFSSPAGDEPMNTVLRRLASPWDESTVTWDGEPTWAEVRASAAVSSTLDWYEWEVTELVADWVAEVHANEGLEIVGDERVQQRERAFYARETATDLFPRLLVDYTDVSDDQPPIVTVDALPDYSRRNYTVSWSGSDQGTAGIDHYDVQYRVDAGDWVDWLFDVAFTAAEFTASENDRIYQFRARGVDRANNVEPFGAPEAQTQVDTKPPTTHVDPLPGVVHTSTFSVSWTGLDEGAGIQYYDVRYRLDGGSWFPWQQQTLATGAEFVALQDGTYGFEARAVDNLGQRESFSGQAEARIVVDVEPPFIVPRVWLPLVFGPWAIVRTR